MKRNQVSRKIKMVIQYQIKRNKMISLMVNQKVWMSLNVLSGKRWKIKNQSDRKRIQNFMKIPSNTKKKLKGSKNQVYKPLRICSLRYPNQMKKKVLGQKMKMREIKHKGLRQEKRKSAAKLIVKQVLQVQKELKVALVVLKIPKMKLNKHKTSITYARPHTIGR